ncbi:MAG: ATP-binding protein [Phycisphaerae bacterium]
MLCDKVKHQDGAQRQLERALAQARVPHSYLFHGPEGVGKETLALAFAAALLEHNGPGSIENHPDVHLIYRELLRFHSDSEIRKQTARELSVHVVRQFIVERADLTSMHGKGKVFLIREAHLMNIQAQNALLKSLEEPSDKTFFVLLASRLDRLLATTLSRCQVVSFDSLPTDFVRTKLAELRPTLGKEELDWCSISADGRIGVAVRLAEDELFAPAMRVVEALIGLDRRSSGAVAKLWLEEAKGVGSRFRNRAKEITDVEALRRGLKEMFRFAADWYADWLRCGETDLPLIYSRFEARTRGFFNAVGVRPCASAIARLARAERHLDNNANPQLAVEDLINDLARVATGRPVALV